MASSSFSLGFMINYNDNLRGYYGIEDLTEDTTFGELKEMIAKRGYTQVVKLNFGDNLSLDDSKTLDQCGINQNTYISVKIKCL